MQHSLLFRLLPRTCVGRPSRKDLSHPGAYAFIHKSTDNVYVGSTQDLYIRISKHYTSLLSNSHRNPNMQAAYRSDVEFEVRYVITNSKEEALKIEQQLIHHYLDSGKLLNVGIDVRAPQRGRPMAEPTREKLRQATIRQFSSEQTRDAQRDRSVEIWKDPAYREKQSRRVRSEEENLKISGKMKQNWGDPEFAARCLAGRNLSVNICGIEFPSVASAAKALGIPVTTLRQRLAAIDKRKRKGISDE